MVPVISNIWLNNSGSINLSYVNIPFNIKQIIKPSLNVGGLLHLYTQKNECFSKENL